MGYQFFDTGRTTLAHIGRTGLCQRALHDVATDRNTFLAVGYTFSACDHPGSHHFFHKQDGFYDLAEGNAVRFMADQGLRVFVYQDFYFNLEYDLRLNTQPAPGREKLDEAFIFGIGYELK